jgi:uncharacterized membrane protein (DUF2068 family)
VSLWQDIKVELGRETQPVDTVVRLIILERAVRGSVLLIAGIALLTNSRAILQQVRNWIFELNLVQVSQLSRSRGLLRAITLAILRPVGVLPPRTVVLIAAGIVLFAVIELTEAIGLARRRRWAEYLTVLAGTIGIPFEVREVLARQTVIRFSFLIVNVAIVIYLAWHKHLFGLRGGRATEAID